MVVIFASILVITGVALLVSANKPSKDDTSIELFGVHLIGSPESILKKLCEGKYIVIDNGPEGFQSKMEDRFSCRVIIAGTPYGMTLVYGKDNEDGVVEAVRFITSETDDSIINNLKSLIIEYYGKPEIEDPVEEQYTWFPKGHFMKARPFHTDEGGWTFYID